MLKALKIFTKDYLAKIRTYSIVLFLLFIFSIFLGYDLARAYPEKTKEIIYDALKALVDPAKDYSSFQLFGFIFFKNFTVAAIGVLLGVIFGIIPVAIILINGLMLGIVSYIILGESGIIIILAGILPHGIIEIPALIFSAASGLWLWRSIYRKLLYDENKLTAEFILIIKFFIFIITPMLALAALIETFITPRILDYIAMF